MSFYLNCHECGVVVELKDGFLKNDKEFNVRIIGDYTIEIKCNTCGNEIVSYND